MKKLLRRIKDYPKAKTTLKTKEKLFLPSLICLFLVLVGFSIKANIKNFRQGVTLPNPTPTTNLKPTNYSPSPIKEFEPTQKPPMGRGGCIIGGCNGEICAEKNIASPCIYKPEFACYKSAKCERQEDGNCGWSPSPDLIACLGASI